LSRKYNNLHKQHLVFTNYNVVANKIIILNNFEAPELRGAGACAPPAPWMVNPALTTTCKVDYCYYYYYYYKSTDHSDDSLKLQGHFTYQI